MFGREPAAIAAVIGIAINLAITFGLRLTIEQVALINALVVAVLALMVRQQVTPVASPTLAVGAPVLIAGTGDTPPADGIVTLKVGG